MLSAGHASTLLYAMLHLTGVKSVNEKYERLGTPTVSLDDLKRFRQLDSKCPGHPEYHLTSGVETTTGRCGRGSPPASAWRSPPTGWRGTSTDRISTLFDYDVFALCGDGCMMEGVSAAKRRRSPAICSSAISAGSTTATTSRSRATPRLAFTEDVAGRFLAYRWHVQRVSDANDRERIADAIAIARRIDDRPSLIIVESHIGYGAPHKQDTSGAPRRASGRGRGQAGQTLLWLARGREVSGAGRRRTSISPEISARRGAKPRAEWMAAVRAL